MNKTYAYLRLSTSESTQKNSFDVQLQHIESKHALNGIYKDTTSGATPFFKREAWTELMTIVQKDDVIVAHRIDRITRDTLQYLVMEDSLKKLGVTLIFIDGVSGNDPTATLIKTILSAVSTFERQMIKLRIKQAKDKMKAEGKHVSGSVPYGFNKDSEGYLIPNDDEQLIVTVMRTAREDMKLSYNKAAGYINDLGYKTRGGKQFTAIGVSRALINNK